MIRFVYFTMLITLVLTSIFFSGCTVYLFIRDKELTTSVISSFTFMITTGILTYLLTGVVQGETTQKQCTETESLYTGGNEQYIGFYKGD